MATANVASKLAVTTRTEKGKGAARRARRAGLVPAVLYGHGATPQHLSLPAREFSAILRNNGLNAIIELDIEGELQIALPKQVDVHPLRNYVEHVDFVIIRKGEKVTVEVAIVVEGDAVSGSLVTNDASVIEIEADALSIPESLIVSIEGLEAGSTITAGDINLPEGVSLVSDPETLILAVNEAQAAQTESDTDAAAPAADAPAAE